jgi:hypothetical protein
MSLYPEGHAARETALDTAYQKLVDVLDGDENSVYTFVGEEVVYHDMPLRDMRGWEWSKWLASIGVQRLEFDRTATREELEDSLDEILKRLLQQPVVTSDAAAVWTGLSRAAFAMEYDEEPPSTEPEAVAEAINKNEGGGGYDQVIVGYLLKIADELRTKKDSEAIALRDRMAELVQHFDKRTIERLLDMGGTEHPHLFKSENRMESAEPDLLELIVEAAEVRAPHLRGHWTRTAALALTLAKEARLSRNEVDDIATAASLLDVGIMYEEFSEVTSEEFFHISSKIRPLTAQEQSLGRALLERTADLVKSVVSWRWNVERYISSSQECYDGSGYPQGLAADEIPVGALRQYDAGQCSADDVFDMLRQHSGTSFDPSLVDAFVESHKVRVLLQSDREA